MMQRYERQHSDTARSKTFNHVGYINVNPKMNNMKNLKCFFFKSLTTQYHLKTLITQ